MRILNSRTNCEKMIGQKNNNSECFLRFKIVVLIIILFFCYDYTLVGLETVIIYQKRNSFRIDSNKY